MSNNTIITDGAKEEVIVPPGRRVTSKFLTEEHRQAYVATVRMFQQGKTDPQELADARRKANDMFGVTDEYNKAVYLHGKDADKLFDSGKFDATESAKSRKIVVTGQYR